MSSLGIAVTVIFGALVLLALFVLGFLLWFIYRLVRGAIRTPAAIGTRISVEKVIAAAVALLFTPALLDYLVTTARALLTALATSVKHLFSVAIQVSASCEDDCTSDVLTPVGEGLSSMLTSIIKALSLDSFPVQTAIVFLILYTVIYLILRLIRNQHPSIKELNESSWPVYFGFSSLVISSLYLCLAALLAIPLMQSHAITQGFTVEDLNSAIAESLPTRETFDKRFPAVTFVRTTAPGVPEPRESVRRLLERASTIADQATTIKESSFREILRLQRTAVSQFKTQNAERLGGRATIDHFGSIFDWYLGEQRKIEQSLADCLRQARAFVRETDSLAEDTLPAELAALEDRVAQMHNRYDRASANCESAQAAVRDIVPERPTRGASLKFVGRWTDWLIDTDSPPLVIIVGLVGFSLLGATISRVVRAGIGPDHSDLSKLSVGDLLMVVAGGVAAALVVFLASYGGLGVLGEASGDPDPYVVFIACFIGAIFSEDVWDAARSRLKERLRQRQQEQNGDTPSPDPANEPGATT